MQEFFILLADGAQRLWTIVAAPNREFALIEASRICDGTQYKVLNAVRAR
jgi:hypothetical protein